MNTKNMLLLLAACAAVPSVNALTDPRSIDSEFRNPVRGCNAIARVWIRAAFHECGTFSKSDGSGGSDGSLQFEWQRPENAGLRTTAEFYHTLVRKFGVSFADAVAYGGIVAVEECGGPKVDFRFGRVDAKQANPDGRLPGPSVSAREILNMFVDRMGFSVEETVALIGGGHTIARVHAENTFGITPGPMDTTENRFDNKFFTELLQSTPPNGVSRLPADQNMAADPQMKPICERFSRDNGAFVDAFRIAYRKMLDLGATFDQSAPKPVISSNGTFEPIPRDPTCTVGYTMSVMSTTMTYMNPTQVPRPTWAPAENSGPMMPYIPQIIREMLSNPKYSHYKKHDRYDHDDDKRESSYKDEKCRDHRREKCNEDYKEHKCDNRKSHYSDDERCSDRQHYRHDKCDENYKRKGCDEDDYSRKPRRHRMYRRHFRSKRSD